jgi:hypothetical protein
MSNFEGGSDRYGMIASQGGGSSRRGTSNPRNSYKVTPSLRAAYTSDGDLDSKKLEKKVTFFND